MLKKLISIVALISVTASTNADTLWCIGKIENAYVSSSSGLYIKPDWGGWKRLCNLKGNFNDIDSDTCKAWVSMAQVAIVADKDLSIKIENVVGDCAIQSDNSGFPKPTYVQLVKN